MTETTTSRRGRPRAGERERREQQVVSAALEELIERGYERVTMLGVASRAGASKETLYNWFGDKEGLFGALIRANADQTLQRLQEALSQDAPHRATLVDFATGLLQMLTGPASVALNRAAMSSPTLAEVLLSQGRRRAGPVVEQYLSRLVDEGHIAIEDPAAAFELLYGLVVRDTQIQTLLGATPPDTAQIRRQAEDAVDYFLLLNDPRRT